MDNGPAHILPSDELLLRFYEPEAPGSHWVSAAALAQALDALQRLVHLTAMRLEGRTPGRRIRPSADIQARYRLICELPKEERTKWESAQHALELSAPQSRFFGLQ
jgi:hypothetical protein